MSGKLSLLASFGLILLSSIFMVLSLVAIEQPPQSENSVIEEYAVLPGDHPHDVAPASDGTVWYTAQRAGAMGRLDPATGEITQIDLGTGSAPHGVIIGPDDAAWVTDGGLNAIVRVDAETEALEFFPLPENIGYTNLNTAAFDTNGTLWFTGQSGVYGRVNMDSGEVEVFEAPRGRGPYGIIGTADGDIYYASLAGSHIARVDIETGEASIIEPPTAGQGARRVWVDSQDRIWVSEWESGQVALYDPATEEWQEWKLPGDRPRAYAVYVDACDVVWLSDFGANALVSFEPDSETFTTYTLPTADAAVRQILGRPGEIWGAESAVDKLVVVYTDCEA